MARPTKFTEERRERFLTALRAGVYPETAAAFAGWSAASYYRHIRGSTPDHAVFREDIRRVETELEIRLVGTVTHAAFGDPRLALALLERRFGERWGRRAIQAPALDGPDLSRQTGDDIVVLEPAEIKALVPKLLAARLGPAGSPEARERIRRFARSYDQDEETD
jgi:hypothetical protein